MRMASYAGRGRRREGSARRRPAGRVRDSRSSRWNQSSVPVGDTVGLCVCGVGKGVGSATQHPFFLVGTRDGAALGATVGPGDGPGVGSAVGPAEGSAVGPAVGPAVGSAVGPTVGPSVGIVVRPNPRPTGAGGPDALRAVRGACSSAPWCPTELQRPPRRRRRRPRARSRTARSPQAEVCPPTRAASTPPRCRACTKRT